MELLNLLYQLLLGFFEFIRVLFILDLKTMLVFTGIIVLLIVGICYVVRLLIRKLQKQAGKLTGERDE